MGSEMETLRDIAQIIYYVALSVLGPLALFQYLKARREDRQEREYETYNELDNRFFEYQKLALEYPDLDILDVPKSHPSVEFDKKRKQEMVAHAILFSLFERAYLMFSNQADAFRQRQWSGWKRFLNDFIRRETVRTAWQLSKETYDTDFQIFMDRKIGEILPKPVVAARLAPRNPVLEARLAPPLNLAAETPVAQMSKAGS
jgi:hypothetical protein